MIADPALLLQRAELLGLPLELREFTPERDPTCQPAGVLTIKPLALASPAQCGVLDVANVEHLLQALRIAVEGCNTSLFDALVTGPLHKGVINEAGHVFSGHTEYLAALTGTPQVVMMLMTEGLRVALVTTHLPLREVCEAITQPRLEQAIRILHRDLTTKFSIAEPNILVCGLNPHAGEDGHLGREEIEVITPVLKKLRAEGMQLIGPLAADSAFVAEQLHSVDVVLAMYHDQGLPALKQRGFGRAVNLTLGLPIIRTSVDHGTALELAGTGRARSESLQAALAVADSLSMAV